MENSKGIDFTRSSILLLWQADQRGIDEPSEVHRAGGGGQQLPSALGVHRGPHIGLPPRSMVLQHDPPPAQCLQQEEGRRRLHPAFALLQVGSPSLTYPFPSISANKKRLKINLGNAFLLSNPNPNSPSLHCHVLCFVFVHSYMFP